MPWTVVFPCPPRSPDFVPDDFHLFSHAGDQLQGSHFNDTVEIKVASKTA
jgi:hypothetical protein